MARINHLLNFKYLFVKLCIYYINNSDTFTNTDNLRYTSNRVYTYITYINIV